MQAINSSEKLYIINKNVVLDTVILCKINRNLAIVFIVN